VLGLGAGYLKPEYKALGVDFDSRNDLMDEYMRAMKLAWTGEDFSFEGTGYTAVGKPRAAHPVQKPHPPLLVGGNSKRALRRTVELGDAWHPFIVPKDGDRHGAHRQHLGDEDIVASIEYMAEHCQKVGRKDSPKVICLGNFLHQAGLERAGGDRPLRPSASRSASHGSGASVQAEAAPNGAISAASSARQ
jgi:alkanesulfonate monooxygenase SsuD/methylene tetrahydromethanopterin reductase-like flavin-dependent oxidoreductase (luciferase family)